MIYLNTCLIFSEFPNDLKELFQIRSDFYELNSLVKNEILFFHYEKLNDSLFSKDYGLLVEDTVGDIGNLIREIAKVDDLKDWIICRDLVTAKKYISTVGRAPVFASLDFSMEGSPVSETQIFYEELRKKWSYPLIIGVTNYENSNDITHVTLTNKMRSHGDSVFQKDLVFEALSNIIRDKLSITKLMQELESNGIGSKSSLKLDESTILLPKESGKNYIVGHSLPMRNIYRELSMLKNTDNRVMLYGETGTGKELIAQAIHEDSSRARAKFVKINCANIVSDSTWAISELFGHKKNAFNGAEDKKGIFQIANGGTVFLDEIECLDKEVQEKLLRFLTDGEFMRLGENIPLQSDVRIICGTNEDLGTKLSRGEFRSDFLSRVSRWLIKLPPLRERKDDIPDLADYFLTEDKKLLLETFGNLNHWGRFKYAKSAFHVLQSLNYKWNVRQLRDTIGSAMVISLFDNILKDGKYLITESHVREAYQKGLGQYVETVVVKPQTRDYYEAEEFLDKVEHILVAHFESYTNVTQQEVAEKFRSKTGQMGISKKHFKNSEFDNNRKSCIEKLHRDHPSRWPNAFKKCSFIRNAKDSATAR